MLGAAASALPWRALRISAVREDEGRVRGVGTLSALPRQQQSTWEGWMELSAAGRCDPEGTA